MTVFQEGQQQKKIALLLLDDPFFCCCCFCLTRLFVSEKSQYRIKTKGIPGSFGLKNSRNPLLGDFLETVRKKKRQLKQKKRNGVFGHSRNWFLIGLRTSGQARKKGRKDARSDGFVVLLTHQISRLLRIFFCSAGRIYFETSLRQINRWRESHSIKTMKCIF